MDGTGKQIGETVCMGYKGYSRDSFGNIVVDNGGFGDSVKEGISIFAVLAICFAFGILCVMLSVYKTEYVISMPRRWGSIATTRF